MRNRAGIRARPVKPPKQCSCLSAAWSAPATKDYLRAFMQFPVPSRQAAYCEHRLREMHRGADWGESWKWGDTSQVSGWLECRGDLIAVSGDLAADPGQGNGAIVQLSITGKTLETIWTTSFILTPPSRGLREWLSVSGQGAERGSMGLKPRATYLAGLSSVQNLFWKSSDGFWSFSSISRTLFTSHWPTRAKEKVWSHVPEIFISISHPSQSCS